MTRDEVIDQLPFYANGTLSPEDRAEVEAALAKDASLRDELAFLTALRDQMQAEPVQSPGEAGLDRLMGKLDAAAPANLPGPPRFWRIAAGVLLAVALAQGALLMSRGPTGGEGTYQLAGDGEAAITVAFRADVTEAELRAVLLAAGLVIVDGPSALGLYGLAHTEGTDLDAAREALEASGIIESLQ